MELCPTGPPGLYRGRTHILTLAGRCKLSEFWLEGTFLGLQSKVEAAALGRRVVLRTHQGQWCPASLWM